MVYETARDLWPVLISKAGLDVPARRAWLRKLLPKRSRGRTSWYDEGLVDDLRQRLFHGAVGHFEDLLDRAEPPLHADKLLRAFFQTLQPFSMMKTDILEMMSAAGAHRGESNLRIRFNFDQSGEPLDLLLSQFREQMEVIEERTKAVLVPAWNKDRPWDFNSIPSDHPDWPKGRLHGPFSHRDRELGDWVANIWSTHEFPPFPVDWQTGYEELDERLARVVGMLEDMLSAYRRYGPNYASLREAAKASDAEATMDPIGFSVRQLSHIESDYWSASVGEWVLKVRQAFAERGGGSSLVGAIISGVDQIFPERRERDITETVRTLIELLNLPVWKRRHEVYSVWIGTQIWRALKTKWQIRFHLQDDTLSFAFSGVHLATLMSLQHDQILAWWTELRTAATNLPSGHRVRAIQPDYRILRSPFSGSDADILVLEVKQYMRGGTANFVAALADYAYACPNAGVLLANYGPVSDGALAALVSSNRHRVSLFGHVRPDRPECCTRLQTAIASTVGLMPAIEPSRAALAIAESSIARIELRWGEMPSDLDLHLVRAASAASGEAHLYFGQRQVGDEAIFHDDVTTGYGPEIISLTNPAGTFRVCVHHYSGAGSLTESGATVDLFSDEAATNRVARFSCPEGRNEKWWLVCEIDCGAGVVREIGKLAPSL